MSKYLQVSLVTLVFLSIGCNLATAEESAEKGKRPNILFAIADDWSHPHAGAYGDPVVKTPAFDRLAAEGALFNHCYVSAPSCTPSRGAILTGQWHWRLETAGNLWSKFPDKFAVYPDMLKAAGYDISFCAKGWGPGHTETKGRQLIGPRVRNFQEFLDKRTKGKPFCFWLGSYDPHRGYKKDSGAASGIDLDKIRLPKCFPDSAEVRGDVADYYFEVQRFDSAVGAALKSLEEIGELDNTLILVTSDNGMPFPRCKSNLYDMGCRMPLAVYWAGKIKPGRVVDDFISFTDFAPTFLEAAGLEIPSDMTGRSFVDVLKSDKSGLVDPKRDYVLFGKERHCPAQEEPKMGGYPCRAIRSHDFLYVRNFDPNRWPAGTPNSDKAGYRKAWYGDIDGGPTKMYMYNNRDKNENHRRLFDLSFGKRPGEELYDLSEDPHQLNNVAADPKYADTLKKLAKQLTDQLRATGDPRIVGGGEKFDEYPYSGGVPTYPGKK